MAKYTFLIPTYKPDYLKEALNSILSQTFVDFNVIISNDCSPFDIKSIVTGFDDSRIIYRENEKNIGGERLVEHWNKLVTLCDSDYLIMAADDDIYNPNFLQDVDTLVNKYPNVDIIRTRTCKINGNNEITDTEGICDEIGTDLDATYNSFCSDQIWCVGNYIFKTEALKKAGGFEDFPYAWFSDLATALKIAKNGIGYTSDNGFRFRLSESNISNTKKYKMLDQQKFEATIRFGEWISEYFSEITPSCDTLSKRRFSKALHCANTIIHSQLGDYGWAVSIRCLLQAYHRISHLNGFSKSSFIKNYTLAMLARKFGKYVGQS